MNEVIKLIATTSALALGLYATSRMAWALCRQDQPHRGYPPQEPPRTSPAAPKPRLRPEPRLPRIVEAAEKGIPCVYVWQSGSIEAVLRDEIFLIDALGIALGREQMCLLGGRARFVPDRVAPPQLAAAPLYCN